MPCQLRLLHRFLITDPKTGAPTLDGSLHFFIQTPVDAQFIMAAVEISLTEDFLFLGTFSYVILIIFITSYRIDGNDKGIR